MGWRGRAFDDDNVDDDDDDDDEITNFNGIDLFSALQCEFPRFP